jgi:hypothetical protein
MQRYDKCHIFTSTLYLALLQVAMYVQTQTLERVLLMVKEHMHNAPHKL